MHLNQCYQILAGSKVVTEFDPNWSNVVSVDNIADRLTAVYAEVKDLLVSDPENTAAIQAKIEELNEIKTDLVNSGFRPEYITEQSLAIDGATSAMSCFAPPVGARLANSCSVEDVVTALDGAENVTKGTPTVEYRVEIANNLLGPTDDQNDLTSNWVEVNGGVVFDSRVINSEDAKALYGTGAIHRPIGHIFVSSTEGRMELGYYGFYKQGGKIKSLPDLAQSSLANTNPTKALADVKAQINKKLSEYSKSSYVMGFITTDVLTPEPTDGAWPKWVVYAISAGIAAHYIDKMNSEIDGIMRRAGGKQGVQYSLKAIASKTFKCYTCVNGTKNLGVNDVWKYGETIHPETRYSSTWLRANYLDIFREFAGNQVQIKVVEKMKIYNYFLQNGHLPPGNKIFR